MSRIEYYRPSIEDVEGMLELERLSFPAPWSLGELKAVLFRDPIVFTLGAFLDSEIVGYISATFSALGLRLILNNSDFPETGSRCSRPAQVPAQILPSLSTKISST